MGHSLGEKRLERTILWEKPGYTPPGYVPAIHHLGMCHLCTTRVCATSVPPGYVPFFTNPGMYRSSPTRVCTGPTHHPGMYWSYPPPGYICLSSHH